MNLNTLAQHVDAADTRYIIGRQHWNYPVTLAKNLFPADPSSHLSNLVWEEDVASLTRRQVQIAGPSQAPPIVNYKMQGQRRWAIPIRLLNGQNDIMQDGNADPAINPRQLRLKWAYYKARLEREIQCAKVIQDPTIMTNNVTLSAGQRFDDIHSAASNPIGVLRYVCRILKQWTQRKVDQIIIPEAGYLKMCEHDAIRDEAVNKLSLASDKLTINNNIIERLIDDSLIEPGAVKTYSLWFNNTPDAPAATEQLKMTYPMGPIVVVCVSAIPGGVGGEENGFGLMKYWDFMKNADALKDIPQQELVTGNEGLGVVNFPLFRNMGGDQFNLINAAVPFVQQERAGFVIYGAFNKNDTATYQDLFKDY